jgi:hypothetical protein
MERWNQLVDIVDGCSVASGSGGGVEKVGRSGLREDLRMLKKKFGKNARVKIVMKRMCSDVEFVGFKGIGGYIDISELMMAMRVVDVLLFLFKSDEVIILPIQT